MIDRNAVEKMVWHYQQYPVRKRGGYYFLGCGGSAGNCIARGK